MKTIKFITLLIFLQKVGYSQTISQLHYVLNGHGEFSDSTFIYGMEQEFETKREYFRINLFSETRLFTGDLNKSILFKIDRKIWYYKYKNEWKLFYNTKLKVGGYIILSKVRYKIKFSKVLNIRNKILHKITLEPIGISQSHKSVYYFNPETGVAIIRTYNGITLLRTDVFGQALSGDELDSL